MQKQFSDLVNAVIPLLPITKKVQVEDYVQCLIRFYQHLSTGGIKGKFKRAACAAKLHEDPAKGLRFLAELEGLGLVETYVSKAGGKKSTTYLQPTEFLSRLLVEHEPYQNTIVYPVADNALIENYEVRIKSEVIDVIKSAAGDAISATKFTINAYILDLLEMFPKYTEKDAEFISYHRAISEARRYRGKVFKFPYFFDSRVRVYNSTTVGFSPQGADHEKALITPKYSEVLTEDGLEALREAILGYSEIEWSDSTVVNFARHPERYSDEWLKADKPYCFMACAEILMRYYDDPTQPLPAFTPLDGRCSGLQHWSAVLATDAITNRLGMEPEEAHDGLDIYEFVALMFSKELPEELATLVNRKLCKKPVMTFAYSATRMSSMDNVADILGEESQWKRDKVTGEGKWVVVKEGLPRHETANLGSKLFNKTNEILLPIVEGVEYLQECVKIIMLHIDSPEIVWATLDGYECKQRCYRKEELKVRVVDSLGRTHSVTLQVPQLDMYGQKVPSITKAQSGIGPNFIHSLDATHLRMVAMRLAELGLPAIWIHDSFAVHSNHRKTLYKIIVEEFIKLYNRNHLLDIKKLWEEAYKVTLPDPPTLGKWDIKSLVNCPRFFE